MKVKQKLIDQRLSNKFAWAAFFGSILVVFIHVGTPNGSMPTVLWWTYQFITEGVCRCAVPFFFVAAGFFLALHYGQEKWWRTALNSRLRTLVIPFLLWNGITLVLTKTWSAADVFAGLGLNPLEYCALNPLWFMRSLMLFVICSVFTFPVLHAVKGKWIFVLVACLVVALAGAGNFYASNARWLNSLKITFSVEGYIYFILGALLAWHGQEWLIRFNHKQVAVIGLILLFCFRFMAIKCGWGGCCRIFVVGAGLCMLWNFSPDFAMPDCVKSCAFPIYILHGIILGVARAFGMSMQLESCFEYWLRGFVCLFVCIFMINIGRKLFPKVFSFAFGGR